MPKKKTKKLTAKSRVRKKSGPGKKRETTSTKKKIVKKKKSVSKGPAVKKSRVKAKKAPNFDLLNKKRQELALSIHESLGPRNRQEKRDMGMFGSLPKTVKKAKTVNKENTVEKQALIMQKTDLPLEKPANSQRQVREIQVRVVAQPQVSRHVVDIKEMLAEKARLEAEKEAKGQRSLVGQLANKKKVCSILNEVSLVNLGQGFYYGVRKAISYLIQLLQRLRKGMALPVKKTKAAIKNQGVKIKQLEFKEKAVPRLRLSFVFSLPQGWHKSIIGFVIVCLVLALPIQAMTYYSKLQQKQVKITGYSAEALVHLQSGVRAAGENSYDSAEEEFGRADMSFDQAQGELAKINTLAYQILSHLPIQGKKIKSGEALLRIGRNISLLGQLFAQSMQGFDFESLEDYSLTDRLNIVMVNCKKIEEVISELEEDMNRVDLSILPGEQEESFRSVQEKLPEIRAAVERLNGLVSMFYEILAPDGIKRYLLIFQNNREMRASGGFMGSYAILDIYRGNIEKFEVPAGGTYDVSGQVLEDIVPPDPLLYISPNWQFHDANWWPDWPTSARKIIWFFEKGAYTTVDGVLTITPTVIESLLPIFGPIDLREKYDTVITEENLVDIIQEEIEYERRADSDKPKQILTDLSVVLLDKILHAEKGQLISSLQTLNEAIFSKHIMFYFPDSELEVLAIENNLAGEIKQTQHDYLNIINTNIGGGKTDHVIDDKIWHQVEILEDGSVINTLNIQRRHMGDPDSFFERHGNVNYMRIYVPLGSELIEAGGFTPPAETKFLSPSLNAMPDADLLRLEGEYIVEPYTKTKIYEQFGKRVFANWTHTEPGETTEIEIKYKLPFKVNTDVEKGWAGWIKEKISWPSELSSYSLMTQKQPGSLAKDYYLKIQYPTGMEVVQKYLPGGCSIDKNAFLCNLELNSDKFFAFIFKDL